MITKIDTCKIKNQPNIKCLFETAITLLKENQNKLRITVQN